jgi:hypothetical protein
MDHRWDESLRHERGARAERERYGAPRVEDDPDVARRDRLRELERRRPTSPWDIGAAHYDQRDLYTRNARIDDEGYGRGPRFHPEIGSYAYTREAPRERRAEEDLEEHYAREAWPWRNYGFHDGEIPRRRSVWDRIRRVLGPHTGKRPKNWRRPDAPIHDDVCVALSEHGDIDATDIEVTVKDGEVTLEGTVRDRGSKRAAEDVAAQVRGVSDVHNRLTIRKRDDDDTAFTMPLRVFG